MASEHKKKKTVYSLRKLQTMMIFLFILPILGLQLLQNFYSLQEFQSGMERNAKGSIYLYQYQTEASIRKVESAVSAFWAQDFDHGKLRYPQTELGSYEAFYNVSVKYKNLMVGEPILAGMFALSYPNHMMWGTYNSATTTYAQREEMEGYVRTLLEEGSFQPGGWVPLALGGRHFLVRSFGNNISYTVCFIDLEQSSKPQDSPHFPKDSFLLYADDQGVPLTSVDRFTATGVQLDPTREEAYFSGKPAHYLIVQTYSPVSNLYVVLLEEYPGFWVRTSQSLLTILLLSGVIVALVPLLALAVKRWYLRPMEDMTSTLREIKTGDLSARFYEDQKMEELKQLSLSFNEMMDQMKHLKIEAYENQIQYQYAQLHYLQLQVSPHFFLNILKTLYWMAGKGKYEKIQNAILMTSDHLRYIFHDNRERVPLETELHHVDNYVRMQQYVTSHEISYHLEVEPGMEGVRVPALSIQTFVENSCKYAMLPDRNLEITVTVQLLCSTQGNSADILIGDNGPGLTPAQLTTFNQPVSFTKEEDHIGIQNVRQRLFLLYGDRHGFACMNTGPGSQFELIIPLEEEENQNESIGRG